MFFIIRFIHGCAILALALLFYYESSYACSEQKPDNTGEVCSKMSCVSDKYIDADAIIKGCTEEVAASYVPEEIANKRLWYSRHRTCLEREIGAVLDSVLKPGHVKVFEEDVKKLNGELRDVFDSVFDDHWICPCGSIVSTLTSMAVDRGLSLVLKFFARKVNACPSSPGRTEEPARGQDVGQPDNASEP